jgi:hypothetical protein
MIAAPLLDAISTDFFEADAAHCDEAATQRDEILALAVARLVVVRSVDTFAARAHESNENAAEA